MITRPWEKSAENRTSLRANEKETDNNTSFSEPVTAFMPNDYLQSSALWHLSKQMTQIRTYQGQINQTVLPQPEVQLRAGDKRKLSLDSDKKKVSWFVKSTIGPHTMFLSSTMARKPACPIG